MATARLNFILYSRSSSVISRCQLISDEFKYSFAATDRINDLLGLDSIYHDINLVVFDSTIDPTTANLSQYAQAIKQLFPDIFVLILAEKKISPAEIGFLKKSGANLVMLDDDFLLTSRFEFVASQVIRAAYIPVKANEFEPDTVLDFSLFHLMPLNQKLFPIVPKGAPISTTRLKKLEGTGELFVRREDLQKYEAYCSSRADKSSEGLQKRCRARYLSLCQSHSKLVFNVIDSSQSATFEEGKKLFETCITLSQDLLYSLTLTGEPWDIVNNSAIGEFGSIERSPSIASYAGLIAVNAQIENPNKVMLSSLLCDLGMLNLAPSITSKIRQSGGLNTLNSDELKLYQQHPKASVTMCLDKRLTLDNSIREIILCTHERADKNGFPDRKANIPMEAMAIQYCELVDNAAMLAMGKERIPIDIVRKSVIAEEIQNAKIFSYNFLLKMKNLLGTT